MAGFDQSQAVALDPTAMGGLSADQMKAFDPTAMAGFDQSKVAALDPTAVGGLSADQMRHSIRLRWPVLIRVRWLRLTTAMAGFDQSKMAALDPTAVAGMQKDQVSNLSKEAVGGLSTAQFEALPDNALAGLDKDNLGGLDASVMGSMTNEVIAKLNPEEVKGLAGDDFSKLATNVDVAKVSNDALGDLLPPGWQMDSSTGNLKAPPGAKIGFKELTTEPTNANTTLPPLPDLSKDLAIGGGSGDTSVIEGLNNALDAADAGSFEFEQRADGILNVKLRAVMVQRLRSFLHSNTVQAPEGLSPEYRLMSEVLMSLQQIRAIKYLMPAIADPD